MQRRVCTVGRAATTPLLSLSDPSPLTKPPSRGVATLAALKLAAGTGHAHHSYQVRAAAAKAKAAAALAAAKGGGTVAGDGSGPTQG